MIAPVLLTEESAGERVEAAVLDSGTPRPTCAYMNFGTRPWIEVLTGLIG